MADTKVSALTEVSVPDLADDLYLVDDTGPTSYKVGTDRLLGLLPSVCDGRLTLTSGTPVTTADVTAATSIYFTPYIGDRIAIYDGTRWRLYAFAELTLALGTLTAALPYDVFIYDNAGTLTLEALAWTNGTTRATALVRQNGVWCKTGALTRRYLGTFYTTATTTTEDSAQKRYLFNRQNRVLRHGRNVPGGSHTIQNVAAREWNNGTAARINFIVGLVEHPVRQTCGFRVDCPSSPNVLAYTNLNGVSGLYVQIFTSGTIALDAVFVDPSDIWIPTLGFNYLTLFEQEAANQSTSVDIPYNLALLVM